MNIIINLCIKTKSKHAVGYINRAHRGTSLKQRISCVLAILSTFRDRKFLVPQKHFRSHWIDKKILIFIFKFLSQIK